MSLPRDVRVDLHVTELLTDEDGAEGCLPGIDTLSYSGKDKEDSKLVHHLQFSTVDSGWPNIATKN